MAAIPQRTWQHADWRARALCARPGVNPEMWFPSVGNSRTMARAKRICAACPVRAQCLDFALTIRPSDGIWAGLTARNLRAEQPRPVPCKRCGTPFVRLNGRTSIYCSDECRTSTFREKKRVSQQRRERIKKARASPESQAVSGQRGAA